MPKRRGAHINPTNRFATKATEADFSQLEYDDDLSAAERTVPTIFLADQSQTILARNDSPDIPFEYSVNPYRGCEHGCAYCYARPTHEMLAMNAGLDFESKIMVKERAPELLRAALEKPSWRPAPISFSGVTDCYQPGATHAATRVAP